MRRLAGALAGACAVIFAVAATPAAANPYVALGDSVTAGWGASTPANDYAHLLYGDPYSALGADELLQRAVPGETSTSMRNGSQLTSGLADINAASDTKAVTIGIGANDYLTGQCRTNWDDPGSCPFRANLAFMLGQLQSALAADPGDEPLVALEYYNPGAGASTEASYATGLLGANGLVGLHDTGADVGLNDVICQETARLGIPVANPYPAFAAQGQALIDSDHLHPNDAGHAVIAASFRNPLAPGACDESSSPPPPAPDTTPPDTVIDGHPPKRLRSRHARFRFESTEAGSTFECRLDRTAWKACSSPAKVRHLDRGRHTFRVRATDAAGNTDASPASDSFRVRRARRHG